MRPIYTILACTITNPDNADGLSPVTPASGMSPASIMDALQIHLMLKVIDLAKINIFVGPHMLGNIKV